MLSGCMYIIGCAPKAVGVDLLGTMVLLWGGWFWHVPLK